MADIFLSYAREDQSRVGPLVSALESQGRSVFWDRRIPAGQTWRSHIGRALDEARCVIVAWSGDSIASDWVIEEADIAKRRGVLVPILLDPVEPPMGLRAIQAADLTDWDADPAAPRFRQLLEDIRAVLSTAPATAPPPLRMGEGAPPMADERPTTQEPRAGNGPRQPETRRFGWRYALYLAALVLLLTGGYFAYRIHIAQQAEQLERTVRLERWVVEAENAIRLAQYDRAKNALRVAAEIDPGDPRLVDLRAELAAAEQKAAEAGKPAQSQRQPGALGQTPLHELSASEVIGADIANGHGETLAEIIDLVKKTGEDQLYAVLSVGGFLGIGDKRKAVPINRFQVTADRQIIMPGASENMLLALPDFLPNQYTSIFPRSDNPP